MTTDTELRLLPSAVPVTNCRSCGDHRLQEFLSLGSTPIANALLAPADSIEPDPSYPLVVGVCETCALVQVMHELPAEVIFGAEYPYFSSFSDQLVRHSRAHVEELVATRRLGPDSLVVEIASNDGYLLREFAPHGVPVLGVEPTPGPAAAARESGVDTIEEFFGIGLGRRLRAERGAADVVLAKNVMAHVPDLNGFVAGMAALVAEDGIVQVENPGLPALLDHAEFDTVYHEHFCYFSTIAVQRLFARHGLVLLDVEQFPGLHGGTLRWTAGTRGMPSKRARAQLDAERAAGLDGTAVYTGFGLRVIQLQHELRSLLRRLRAEGATIAAYGAAAKGATLLNSSGIGANLIDFVVDRNPHKQGRLMPGARLPILDPSALLERRPDYVVLLAWNVAEEVVAQQRAYTDAGGRFIVPVPKPRILGS
ncbi:class I SAM-dependent methyltransferase [Pseudonocardia nematodicida]|uniref:Class I SAM-dependent methyltransferase n=1 Tax=Pseudonocardia nematodicida TaxID=1206997 RepID=A0ABV1K3F3_9PSEU